MSLHRYTFLSFNTVFVGTVGQFQIDENMFWNVQFKM